MYRIERFVGNSHVGADGRLTLGAAVDFMQDCSGFQLDNEKELSRYFRQHNVTMFLVSRQINIHKPVFYGEKVEVVTTIYQLKNSYGFRNTNIYDEDGNVRISSYAGGAFIDLERRRATTLPEEIAATVPIEEKFEGMEYLPRKIRLPKKTGESGGMEPEIMEGMKVCRYHIDKNAHMNNSRYLQLAQECIPEDFPIATARIEYKTAAKLGDMLIPYTYHLDDGITIVSLQDGNGGVFANVEFRK